MAKNSGGASTSKEVADASQRCSANHVVSKWINSSNNNKTSMLPQADAEQISPQARAEMIKLDLNSHGTPLQQINHKITHMSEFLAEERRQLKNWMSTAESRQEEAVDKFTQYLRHEMEKFKKDFVEVLHVELKEQQDTVKQLRSELQVHREERRRSLTDMLKAPAYPSEQTQSAGHPSMASGQPRNQSMVSGQTRYQSLFSAEQRALPSVSAGQSLDYQPHDSMMAHRPTEVQDPERLEIPVGPRVSGSMDSSAYMDETKKLAEDVKGMDQATHYYSISQMIFGVLGMSRERQLKLQRQPQNILVDFVDNRVFDWICSLAIILNAIWIGVTSEELIRDYIKTGSSEDDVLVRWFSRGFVAWFTLEMIIKLYAYRFYFFFGTNWQWRVFDLFVVVVSLIDLTITNYDTSLLRSFRMLRLARTGRVIRVLRVSSARFLFSAWLYGLLNGQVLWSLVFFTFLTYFFAIVFVQGLVYMGPEAKDVNFDSPEWQALDRDYGSVGRAMWTLMQAVTFGQPWEELVVPLRRLHWTLEHLFAFYVLFTLFCTLNLIGAVFHDCAQQTKLHRRELVIGSHMRNLQSFSDDLREIYVEVSKTRDDQEMDVEEFKKSLSHPAMIMYLDAKGIDVAEVPHLLQIFTEQDLMSHKGKIPVDDFVFSCARAQGLARQMELSMVKDLVIAQSHKVIINTDKMIMLQAMMEKIFVDIDFTKEALGHLALDIKGLPGYTDTQTDV